MSKSTQATSATPTLIDLKLAVINHHKGEWNEYLRTSIARDACYTSHNSLNWKTEQILKVKEDIAILVPDSGNEVTDVNLQKKIEIYQRMEDELAELTERHEADKEVYFRLTEEVWTINKKKKVATNATVEAAKAILAK